MKNVPAFYMFLPWQILLRYAASQAGNDKFPIPSNAFVSEDDTEALGDEHDFRSELKISLPKIRGIQHSFHREVCVLIEKVWHDKIHEEHKTISIPGIPDFTSLFKKAIKKKVYKKTTKSRLHEKVDIVLKYDRNSNVDQSWVLVVSGMAFDAESMSPGLLTAQESEALSAIIKKVSEDQIPIKVALNNGLVSSPNSNPEFPSEFAKTSWQCFERKDSTQDAKWGIAVSILNIEDPKNKDFIRLYDKIGQSYDPTYVGSGQLLQHESYLEIRLSSRDTPGKICILFLKVDTKPRDQSVFIGFSLKFSRRYKRYLVKTILLRKSGSKEHNDHEMDKEKRLIPFTVFDSDIEKVDLEIRRFLWNRKRNRMSLPISISNANENDREGSLQTWQSQRYSEVFSDYLLPSLKGQYLLFYEDSRDNNVQNSQLGSRRKSKNSVGYDQLEITLNPNAVGYEATLVHRRRSKSEDSSVTEFTGKVRHLGATVEIIFEQKDTPFDPNKEIFGGTSTQGNYAYLTFSAWGPVTDKTVFEGSLTRILDDRTAPACFRCFIVKENSLNGNSEALLNRVTKTIKSYFQESEGKNVITIPVRTREL